MAKDYYKNCDAPELDATFWEVYGEPETKYEETTETVGSVIDYDKLETFFYVAKFGTFTEAAKRLTLTQPAVSLRIKNLEARIGQKLIIRHQKGSKRNSLTPFGHKLYFQLITVIDEMKAINQLCTGV